MFRNLHKSAGMFVGVLGVVGMLSMTSPLSASTPAVPAGTPVATAATTLDDATLTSKALALAQFYGLKGAPISQTAVRMTLAEWGKLIDAELGKDAAKFGLTPDMPVFVFALHGNVTWQGFGFQHLPEGTGEGERTQFDNMTIVLDAKTGNMIDVQCDPPDRSMPVPVP